MNRRDSVLPPNLERIEGPAFSRRAQAVDLAHDGVFGGLGAFGVEGGIEAPDALVEGARAVDEAVCLNTVVLWWTERISEAEARLIGTAIRKVIGSYEL